MAKTNDRWRKVEVEQCEKPLIHSLIASYDVQSMLYNQCNFPRFAYVPKDYDRSDPLGTKVGDWIGSTYEDRARDAWDWAWQKVGRDTQLYYMKPTDFLRFATIFFEAMDCKFDGGLTGARAVRYTNVSSGYPTVRIDGFWKHPDTPKSEPLGYPTDALDRFSMDLYDNLGLGRRRHD